MNTYEDGAGMSLGHAKKQALFTNHQFQQLTGGTRMYTDADLYQQAASITARYADMGGPGGLAYLSSGLASEAGEVCQLIKRAQADGRELRPDEVFALVFECGDVLWYVSEILRHHGVDLSLAMQANGVKLLQRHAKAASNEYGHDWRHTLTPPLGSRHDGLGDRVTGKSAPRTSHGTDPSLRSRDGSEEGVPGRKARRAATAKVRSVRRAARKGRTRT